LIISAIKNYKFLLSFYYPIPLFGIIAALYPTFFSLFQPNAFDHDLIDSSMNHNNGDDDDGMLLGNNIYYSRDNTCSNIDNTKQECYDDDYHNLSPVNTVAVEISSSDEWGHFADFFEDAHHHHNTHPQHNQCNSNINHSLGNLSCSLVQSSSSLQER